MKKSFLLPMICCTLVLFFAACSTKNDTVTTVTTTVTEQKSILTEGEAGHEGYHFSVEVDDWESDVFEAGTYIFDTTNKKLGKAPIFDIEIQNQNADENMKHRTYSVGGVDSAPTEIELISGDHVSIVLYPDLVYTPSGNCVFKEAE